VDPSVSHLDITAMVTDGTSLYWTSDLQQLLTCAVGDSCAAPSVVLGPTALQASIPNAMSIYGADLYITTGAGNIFRCVAQTCASTIELVAKDEVVVGAAAADDAAVYWVGRSAVDAGGGAQAFRLMRLAK